MSRDRIIQLAAGVVLVVAAGAGGAMLPTLNDKAESHALRYTDKVTEGMPPFVALGTMIGALRGVIVDYLWIKVNIMKEKGLFYEVMADSEMITKLQPRFAPVWAFHGHNMAYNISVAMNTEQERWEFVNAGIRLVREQGLRYNPNDLVLYKELSFWFAHKIDGYSDDAHLYYKTQFCREWHDLLGQPPDVWEDRIEWMRVVAEAPDTLEDAIAMHPEIPGIIQRFKDAIPIDNAAGYEFDLDQFFLRMVSNWHAVTEQSHMAQARGVLQQVEREPAFVALTEVITDPELADAWETLIAHTRKRILIDDYNMNPTKMFEYTREIGPIDWRVAQSHALYWSRLGSQIGELRQTNDDDIYKIVNNDRIQLQAMQGLARHGRVFYDPFSPEMPSRLPDPRWVDGIMRAFNDTYIKHMQTRGAGGDGFIGFYENFMSAAVRESYRSGDHGRAQQLLDHLDSLFGRGADLQSNRFHVPLDIFVANDTRDNYQQQPALAPSEVAAGLRYGFLQGILNDEPEIFQESLRFAHNVIELFRSDQSFSNRFGRQRMAELVADLEASVMVVLQSVMIDPSINMERRRDLWRKIDEHDPLLRAYTYDDIKPYLEQELARSALGQVYSIEDVLPEPPGLAEARRAIAEAQAAAARELEQGRNRDDADRKGN